MDHSKDIMRVLGQLEGAVKGIDARLERIETGTTGRINLHAGRIGSLENSRAKLWGGMAVLSLAASMLGLDSILEWWHRVPK